MTCKLKQTLFLLVVTVFVTTINSEPEELPLLRLPYIHLFAYGQPLPHPPHPWKDCPGSLFSLCAFLL